MFSRNKRLTVFFTDKKSFPRIFIEFYFLDERVFLEIYIIKGSQLLSPIAFFYFSLQFVHDILGTSDGSSIKIKHILLCLNTNTNYFTLTMLIYQCVFHFKIIGSFIIFHQDF